MTLAVAAGLIFLFGGMVIAFGKALAADPVDWRWLSVACVFAAVFILPIAARIALAP